MSNACVDYSNILILNIYASDLAAAIGRHPYKTVVETIKKIWRSHDPTVYAAALARNKITEAQTVEQYMNYFYTKQSTSTCYQPPNIMVATQIPNIYEVEPDQIDVTALVNQLTVCCPQFSRNEITGYVYCEFGRQQEARTRQLYAEQTGIAISKDNKLYKKIFTIRPNVDPTRFGPTDGHNLFSISGICDGMAADDSLIEIKNRISRIYGRVQSHERIQMYTYLALMGRHRCTLVQQYKNDIVAEYVYFNKGSWTKILNEAREFARLINYIRTNSAAQDALLIHGDLPDIGQKIKN
jgi:hypothetical protein